MSCCLSCCAASTCGLCGSVASGISSKSARLAYCGLFGLSLIVSWILREVGAPLLEKIPWISSSETHTKEWYQTEAVLRVSMGNFLFFAAFALIMIGVKDQNDRRDSWHHGGWIAKMVVWLLLVVLMFFMPDIVITIYGVLFIWFNPSGEDCGLNIFFIVMTMILAFGFAVIALHPKVNGSLLPASVISVYSAYVCYTALSSEPHGYACNGLHHSKAVSLSTLLLGMAMTVLSVLYSALRAGSSTNFLSPPSSPRGGAAEKTPLLDGKELEEGKEKNDKEVKPVGYSYTFFHLIFALASMYSAMLLSGWTSSSESSDLIDVGWTSVWVRICTEWVTAALYVWSLIAPILIPDREF
ncbi:hypothetical protein DVH24_041501 [Malus domestica]|uniref:Serine incorporator n=1 Tax=Malus domestica TaxID=3750 RepID=A0A498IE27_MALDO|nr:hypothetical protein DVH24_041501 [Malus domestica]